MYCIPEPSSSLPGLPKPPPPGVSGNQPLLLRPRVPAAFCVLTDDDHVARQALHLVPSSQVDGRLDAVPLPDPQVLASRTGLSAVHPVRRVRPPVTEDRTVDGPRELDGSDTALSSLVTAVSARSLSQRVLADDEGVRSLGELHVTDARVGHVDVRRRLTVPRCTRLHVS